MFDELQELVSSQGIKTAAIIDDVFDEVPTARDIDDASWGFFRDDLGESELELIKSGYGISNAETRMEELRNDDKFFQFLWGQRAQNAIVAALFRSFEEGRNDGRNTLEPLRSLLFEQLKLGGGTFGSTDQEAGQGAELLFVDLFLGTLQDANARQKAVQRVRGIVESRRKSPPLIVLMSQSVKLSEMREAFRNDAGLFGSQFRTILKSDIADANELHDVLYPLVKNYKHSQLLSDFTETWRESLENATLRFMEKVRRLDLRDYADLQQLVLEAEGEAAGHYLLEVFGTFFQFELEEDEQLSTAALRMNGVRWEDYPVPHFLPDPMSMELADGIVFRSSKVTTPADPPLQFGDVLFSARVDALGENSTPVADFAKGERIALLVMTAECDIQHCNSKRTLLIGGRAQPISVAHYKPRDKTITPIIRFDGKDFMITWDLDDPISWSPAEQTKYLASGDFLRVRRFRTLFALQLQHLFASSLRVGTPAIPPLRFAAGVSIGYVNADSTFVEVIKASSAENKAVLQVGRDSKSDVNRFALDSTLVKDLRTALRNLKKEQLRPKDADKTLEAVATQQFFALLENGVKYERKGQERCFKEYDKLDVLTVVGPSVKGGLQAVHTPQGKVLGDKGPILVILESDVPS